MSVQIHSKRYKEKTYKYMSDNHSHAYYELYYLKSGSRTYHTSEMSMRFSSGSFVLIEPGILHSMKGTVTECSIIRFENDDIAPDILTELKKCFHEKKILYVAGEKRREIEDMISKLDTEYYHSEQFGGKMFKNMLEILFILLIRTGTDMDSAAADNKLEAIMFAVKFIEENYSKKITIRELAKGACMSESYFAHCFKNIIGTAPIDYLNQVRVTAAARLAPSDDLKISDVATRVGFSNSSYLCYMFKKHTGITYRKYGKVSDEKMNKDNSKKI